MQHNGPEIEARFRRIEDAQIVAAELLHQFERKTDERLDHLEAIQNAMARWMDRLADQQERADQETAEIRHDLQELRQIVADLALTVDRYLRSRTNGHNN